MPVGDNIRTVEYNNIQSKVSNILGTGSASVGYGQIVQSSQVDTDDSITVNEWGRLRNDIINIYRHQNNSIPSTSVLPEALLGESVRYNITDAPVTVWDTLSTTLEASRVDPLPVGRFGSRDPEPNSQTVSFKRKAVVTVTFEWNTAEQARFFFNGGGRLRIESSFSASLLTDQPIAWGTLLGTIGIREWGGFFPDTSIAGTDGRNWHKSDGTAREFFNQNSSTYTANFYRLRASKNSNFVYIEIELDDSYTDLPENDPDNPAPNDLVQGEITVLPSYTYPAGAMTGLGVANWNGYEPSNISVGTWSLDPT